MHSDEWWEDPAIDLLTNIASAAQNVVLAHKGMGDHNESLEKLRKLLVDYLDFLTEELFTEEQG